MSGEAFEKLDDDLMEIELGVRAIDLIAEVAVQATEGLERERAALAIGWCTRRLLPMVAEAATCAEVKARRARGGDQ